MINNNNKMNKEQIEILKEKEERINNLILGAREFLKLVLSMKEELKDMNLLTVFVSGMVGYSCQAAYLKKNPINNLLLRLMSNKIAISGEAIYNYLYKSKNSLYNFLSGQFHDKLPNTKIPSFDSYYFEVGINIGNKNYKIEKIFSPETIFNLNLYSSTWEKFYANLDRYCKTSDEWPILFSVVLYNLLEVIYICGGKDSYTLFFDIVFKNAIYVSKIPQL